MGRFGFHATFYVVTGWVRPHRVRVSERFNAGRDHGTWPFWREIAGLGHEVGSHGFSHLNASGTLARLFPWLVEKDIGRSAQDLKEQIPGPTPTMSMPWNAATSRSAQVVRRHFSGCRLGSSRISYNRLSNLSRFELESWAPRPDDPWDQYVDAVEQLPAGGWLIFQFHSFEEEGWDPIEPELLERLCELISSRGVRVRTVRDTLAEHRPEKAA